MEETRISRMYLALLKKRLAGLFGRFSSKDLMRSGGVTAVLVALLIGSVVFVYRERGRGHLHKLTTELQGAPPPEEPRKPRPGGQDPIVLSRQRDPGGMTPEFLSATLLPGRGLNVLQITAYVPGKGEVPLLLSPSLDEAAARMNEGADSVAGAASLAMGGAFEVPWSGQMGGAVLLNGETVMASWRGHSLKLPAWRAGDRFPTSALGGLLLARDSESADSSVLPDGAQADALFRTGDFDGRWPSQTEVTVLVIMTSRSMQMTVVARNTGAEPEPIGIGWRPRFAVSSGERAQVRLHIPSSTRVQVDSRSALPTGKLLPVAGTGYDFSDRMGAALGSLNLDDTYVHLHPAMLDSGTVAELRNVSANYGLRMTAMGTNVKAMHVLSPVDGGFVSIDPQMNLDDPFGREWPRDEDTGMAVLAPGQSVQWRVKLELFPIHVEGQSM